MVEKIKKIIIFNLVVYSASIPNDVSSCNISMSQKGRTYLVFLFRIENGHENMSKSSMTKRNSIWILSVVCLNVCNNWLWIWWRWMHFGSYTKSLLICHKRERELVLRSNLMERLYHIRTFKHSKCTAWAGSDLNLSCNSSQPHRTWKKESKLWKPQ